MDNDKFNLIMDGIKEVRSNVKDIHNEQISHGKSLAKVCDKVKSHSWIHRTTGLAFVGLLVAWFKNKFS